MSKLPARSDFPSNSIEPIEQKATAAEVAIGGSSRRVVKGRVMRKKKTLTSGFSDAFFGEQAENVVGYAINEVLLPALKNVISEMVGSSLDMMLFGETRAKHGKRNRSGSTISYGSFYQDIAGGRNNRAPMRPGLRFEDIILEDRGEAEDVIESLVDLLEEYEQVTVGDLYELVGMEGKHTDNKYGWTNLSKASVRRVSGGYLLDLPRPVELDL